MNQYKKRYRNEVMKKKREEQKKIKTDFVDTGAADNIINEVKRKSQPTVKVEDLPF